MSTDQMLVTLRVADLRAIIREEVSRLVATPERSVTSLTVPNAAKAYGVPVYQIRAAIKSGALATFGNPNRLRVRCTDLDALFGAKATQGSTPRVQLEASKELLPGGGTPRGDRGQP
jgi:hypothetical protein